MRGGERGRARRHLASHLSSLTSGLVLRSSHWSTTGPTCPGSPSLVGAYDAPIEFGRLRTINIVDTDTPDGGESHEGRRA